MSENIELKTELTALEKPVIKKVVTKRAVALKEVELSTTSTEPVKVVEVVEDKEAIQYRRDHLPVKGIFRNLETPGGSLTFPFRKYKKDKIKTYTLYDGEPAELPMMVVDHLNEGCTTPKYIHIPGTTMIAGQASQTSGAGDVGSIRGLTVVGRNKRFEFKPIGFIHSPYEEMAKYR